MAGKGAAGLTATPSTVTAPAKLTVSLRVTGRRPDGYHLLDAEMVSIDLADELVFHSSTSTGDVDAAVAVEVVPADVGSKAPNLPTGEDNLICKALRAVGRRSRVRLHKRIPPGAGLGGGSADAAAVLRWAGCEDLRVAASLGADVPFCLLGGRAKVSGIGEVVDPLPFEPRTYTLLIPPFGCSTPKVYRAWDDLESDGRSDARDGERNDLERAALVVEPRLARWRDRLASATGQRPQLAGSGSTWFIEGAFPGDDRIVVKALPPHSV